MQLKNVLQIAPRKIAYVIVKRQGWIEGRKDGRTDGKTGRQTDIRIAGQPDLPLASCLNC